MMGIMNNSLILTYNEKEKTALENCTYLERSMFRPVTHLAAGDPTYVNNIKELIYFIDTMHPLDGLSTINDKLKGLTKSELNIFSKVARSVYLLSKKINPNLPSTTKSCLLTQIYQRKMFNAICPNAKVVLEIGPGSGYLSLMLALDGNAIISTDVTQAPYLYQSLLFDQFEINIEFLEDDNSSITPEKGKILHLPWWKYKDIRYNMYHKVDAIIINHAVSEMDPYALRSSLKAALSLGNPVFFIEGMGSNKLHTFHNAIKIFEEYGYQIMPVTGHDIWIFEYKKRINKYLNTTFRLRQNFILMYFFPIFAKYWNKMFIKSLPTPPESGESSKTQSLTLNKNNKYFIEDVNRILKRITGEDNYEHPNTKYMLSIENSELTNLRK